jgi:hypothetical protein
MVVNFRARGISRGARKLARTPTLNYSKKKKKKRKKKTQKIPSQPAGEYKRGEIAQYILWQSARIWTLLCSFLDVLLQILRIVSYFAKTIHEIKQYNSFSK